MDLAGCFKTIELDVEGMTCAACAAAVARALEGIDGVASARVSATSHKARVISEVVKPEPLIDAIQSIGFDASPVPSKKLLHGEKGTSKADLEVSTWLKRAIRSACCFILIVLADFLPENKNPFCHGEVSTRLAVHIIAAVSVQLFVAPVYYHGALTKPAGMDLLVSSASALTFAYSVLNLIASCILNQAAHTNFDSAVALLSFVTLGKFLEAHAKREAGNAVAKIRRLEPTTAILLCPDQRQCIIPKEEVAVGDQILVFAGKAFPIDGVLASVVVDDTRSNNFASDYSQTNDNEASSTYADESAITGESLPVRKCIGDPVLGGTVCLGSGSSRRCIVEAIRPGSDTAVSRIAALVEEAQLGGQTQVELAADAVARVFAPCVLTLSVVTLTIWLLRTHSLATALVFAISVVVVACPCALGLAAPTAIICGCGVGARLGVLFKSGGEGLENLAETIRAAQRTDLKNKVAVAIDKTGTLTVGKPSVVDFKLWGEGIDLRDFFGLAAAAERESDHPIAVAIRRHAEIRLGADQCAFYQTIRGRAFTTGVDSYIRCTTDDDEDKTCRVCVGSLAFCLEHATPHSWFDSETCIRHWRSDRALAVSAVAIDGILVGALALADAPRPEARDIVTWLQQVQAFDVHMLTGDDATTASAIARAVGIEKDRVYANLKPADKASILKSINAHIFVGDGVNDAVALAAAPIGVAVGDSAAIAADAADIVLTRTDLSGLVTAMDLAVAVVYRIKLNFLWASIYNALVLPIAAGVAYPAISLTPGLAAACMAFSSVSVVTSSLLLKRYSPPTSFHTESQRQKDHDHCSSCKEMAPPVVTLRSVFDYEDGQFGRILREYLPAWTLSFYSFLSCRLYNAH